MRAIPSLRPPRNESILFTAPLFSRCMGIVFYIYSAATEFTCLACTEMVTWYKTGS